MKYKFFTTDCRLADNFLDDTLSRVENGLIDLEQAFKNLQKLETVGDDGEPNFPDSDLVKETIYDLVENLSKITNKSQDEVWEVYDFVYNDEWYNTNEGKC